MYSMNINISSQCYKKTIRSNWANKIKIYINLQNMLMKVLKYYILLTDFHKTSAILFHIFFLSCCPIYPNSSLHAQIFLPLFPSQTQINPTHADKWNAVQGSVVRQARLHRPGYRVHWRLSICAGEVPSERGQFLQSSGWLLDLLRESQLPWPPVLPGEGQLPQTSGVGCGLSHRAVFPSLHWVMSLCPQYLGYLAVTHWSSIWNKVWLEIHSAAHLLLVCSLYLD